MNFNKLKNLNYLLIFVLFFLCIIGSFGLYSAADGSFEPWAAKHMTRFSVFLFCTFFLSLIDIKLLYKYSYLIFILFLALLISVEIIGVLGKGASRWIHIFGFSIQPSELMKVFIILALAKYYHDLRFDNIGNPLFLLFPLIIIFLPAFFVLIQPDLGTAVSIVILGIAVLFTSGVKIWKFALGFLMTLVSIPFIWNVIKPYQKNRIISFLNPESDPLGQGYQLIQSKIALGSGGMTGKGFLKGTQSYLEYLPEKQTDFIFTLIGEEFGFLGTTFIILLFFILISICYYVGIKSIHVFGRILALGIGTNLFIYVIMNIAMVSGMMPVVGIPLPLISYGGTAMLSIMISMGILLNIDLNYNIKKLG